MRLVDLEPRWWAEHGRHGQGVSFLCPHCILAKSPNPNPQRLGVAFANPLDAGAPCNLGVEANLQRVHEHGMFDVPPGFHWKRKGDTFEELTLEPSVNCEASGHWHGFVTKGEVT